MWLVSTIKHLLCLPSTFHFSHLLTSTATILLCFLEFVLDSPYNLELEVFVLNVLELFHLKLMFSNFIHIVAMPFLFSQV